MRHYCASIFCTLILSLLLAGNAKALEDNITQTVTHNGETITLRLTRQVLRGLHFEVMVQNSSGGFDAYTPGEERSYLGTVDEYPGAVSAGIVQDDGTVRGFVIFDRGGTWFTSGQNVTYKRGVDDWKNFGFPSYSLTPGLAGNTTYAFDTAVDVNYAYYSGVAGSSVAKAFENVEYTYACMRALYMSNAMLRPYLARVIIRGNSVQDPYQTDIVGLGPLTDEWRANQTDAIRDFVSGFGKGSGGQAWSSSIGNTWGYNVSQSSSDNHYVVARHEVAHNFSVNHEDGGAPEGSTTNSEKNRLSRFSGPEIEKMFKKRDAWVASGYLDSEGTYTAINLPPYAGLDSAVFRRGIDTSVTIDVMANDHDVNGDAITGIVSFDTTSNVGGTVTMTGTGTSAQLVYTPPAQLAGFDWFKYTITEATGKTATGLVCIHVNSEEDLVAHLKLDDATDATELVDASGNLNLATSASKLVTSAGKFGGAVTMANSDDYIQVTGADFTSTTATLTAWVKRADLNQVSSAAIVFNEDSRSGLNFTSGNALFYHWNGGKWSWNSGLIPPANQWVFVALVVEPTKATIYMHDGTTMQSATNTSTHTAANFTGKTFLGWESAFDARKYKGDIDDVRIYKRALNSSELTDLVNGGGATVPQPFNGATLISSRVLKWTSSPGSTQSQVYLGTSQSNVAAATTASAEYVGATPGNDMLVSLLPNTTYFWRVDSVNASATVAGKVWSFSTGSTINDIDTGLLAHWTFNDGSGNTLADSAGSHAGALQNGPVWKNSPNGGSLSFDGVDDHVVINQGLSDGGNSKTIVSWVKLPATDQKSGGAVYFSRNNNASGLNIGSGNALGYHWDGDEWWWSSGLSVPKEKWVLVALVESTDGSTVYYHDGSLQASANAEFHTPEAFNGISYIGWDPGNNSRDFTGEIDDLRVYGRALHASELEELYQQFLNHAPVVNDQNLALPENISTGSVVADAAATDANADDVLSYAITVGNDGTFAIDSSTGEISLAASMDYETTTSYTLTVEVTDADGLTDSASINVSVTDVANDDSDADGLVDEWEVANFGSVAATTGTADSDNDGLTNAGEYTAGTDPNSADSDSDGYSDFLEIAEGSNPLDSQSLPSIAGGPGLVAYWKLDDASGQTAADSVGLYNGTLANGPIWTAGKDGGALDFDGVDDKVTAPALNLNSNTVTISGWVKRNGEESFAGIVFCRGGSTVSGLHISNNELRYHWDSGKWGWSSGLILPDGVWAYVALVVEPDKATIYMNDGTGMQSAVNVSSHAIEAFDAQTALGVDPTGGARFFNGAMDDVRIYGRALSAAEVTAIAEEHDTPNAAPVATDATFSIDENTAAGTVLGTVSATDPDAGDTLSYAITAGNTGGEFSINSSTGEITTTALLDHEYASQYVLTVAVSDGSLNDTANVTVDVNDLNEAPVANLVFGSVSEDAIVGTNVTTVTGFDQDAGDSISYAIIGGNSGDAFAINSSTGEITTVTTLDFETTPSYSLLVELIDNGGLTAQTTVGVNVGNILNDDSDSDGLADEWEVSNFGSVAYTTGAVDSDGDGLSNASELAAGTDPNNIDSDGDGYSDSAEIAVGTDPNNSASNPAPKDLVWTGAAGDGDFFNEANWDGDSGAAGTQAPVADSVNPGIELNALSLTVNGADFFDLDGYIIPNGASISLSESNLTTSGSYGINATSSLVSILDIGAGSYASFQFLANIDANLTGDAILELRGAGNPVNASTIDFAAGCTGYIRFTNETVTGVINEHLSKFTVDGAAAVLNSNIYIYDENGDTIVSPVSPNNAPAAFDASFSVSENVAIGTSVGTVTASDPDAGDSLSYAITSGNVGGTFTINSSTGEITTAAALDYETATSYLLIVSVTDGGGLSDNALVDIAINNVADVATYYTSVSESTSKGSIISGSLADAQSSNNVYEVLQEAKTGGNPSTRVSSLEHVWSFNIGNGGLMVELGVEAFHSSNNEGDDFIFSYSTDGTNYTDLITVTKTSDNNAAQVAALPAGVNGVVYIRVRDANRTAGNGSQDTLSIDRLNMIVSQ